MIYKHITNNFNYKPAGALAGEGGYPQEDQQGGAQEGDLQDPSSFPHW